VSRATGGAPADGNSGGPAISADGRFVAFHSDADNLSNEDENSVGNVFVRDMRTNTATLVSRAAGPGGSAGDDDSFARPALSADGRVVAFQSIADNLSSEDDDGVGNIFARDLRDHTTKLASRASGPGGAGADQEAFSPAIAADGRRVVFGSGADNLSSEDDDRYVNIFVRDLRDNTTTLVSRAGGPGGAGGNAGSSGPLTISADRRFVAFTSDADNLSNEDDDGVGNVFVRDLRRNTTTLVSRATGVRGAAAHRDSSSPAISGDGRLVAFLAFANNLSAEDDNAVLNIFLRDLRGNTTELVSRAEGTRGAAANDNSYGPAIVGGGRLVGFSTNADNLSAEDDNAVDNVFVRDVLGRPHEATVGAGGGSPRSWAPSGATSSSAPRAATSSQPSEAATW